MLRGGGGIEENLMLIFLHNRKLMNAGALKEDRRELFLSLSELGMKYKRVNQWRWRVAGGNG